jgi:nuclease S1
MILCGKSPKNKFVLGSERATQVRDAQILEMMHEHFLARLVHKCWPFVLALFRHHCPMRFVSSAFMRFSGCHRIGLTLLLCGLGLSSNLARAWGEDGHKIVATLADAQLSPVARREVNRLLALEPGQSLASISTWADEHRNPATAAWHYVNFPRGNCNYQPERNCPDGKCVVAAIDRQIETLRITGDDVKRLTALKYLVHLMGDIHQPLHAGWGDDRGGNSYQLQAFMRGSNLHALWDSGLIKALGQDNESIVRGILIRPNPAAKDPFNPATAAEESCRIVAKPGFYPERTVTQDYVEGFTPIMLSQLALAGSRLAQSLNTIFK